MWHLNGVAMPTLTPTLVTEPELCKMAGWCSGSVVMEAGQGSQREYGNRTHFCISFKLLQNQVF